jgi:hypothetical protein
MCSQYASGERDIYAVLGSPDSGIVVRAPEDRNEARRLKSASTFHCSVVLGGCGGELIFAIGDVNIPHFRHQGGSKCSLVSSGSAADRYTHLAIQEALRSWIQGMPGFSCKLEVSIENGRTDVLATGPSFEAALEVQRSQLSSRNAQERTARYLHRASAVDWLYAYQNIDAHKAEIAERGWSLRIWWGWAKQECRLGVSYETGIGPEAEVKQIGGPLSEWELTPAGLDSVHLRTAKESVRAWREAERLRIQEEADDAAHREAVKRQRDAAARKKAGEQQKAARDMLVEQLGRTPQGLEGGWPSHWPELKGSPRQVQWAEGLRAQMVEILREEIMMKWLDEDRGLPVARWLALQSSAGFWIQTCRYADLIDVLKLYENLFGRTR